MSNYTITVDDKDLKKGLRQLEKAVKDMRPIFNDINTVMFEDVQDHFIKEKGPAGKWKGLSPETLKARRKEGRGAKILQDTGRLRTSFYGVTKKKEAALVNSTLRVVSGGKTFTNVKGKKPKFQYGAEHNFGLNGMPKREFMYLTSKAVKDITTLVLDEIKNAWVK